VGIRRGRSSTKGHLAGKRAKDRRVLAADRATTDDHEPADGFVEIQDGRGVNHVGIVEVDPGG